MKQLLCNTCLAVAMLLASSVWGWPSGWPVTNTVHHWELYDGKHDLRTVVALSLLRSPRDYRLPRPDDTLLLYAKNNGIPVHDMVTEAKNVAEEGLAMLSSGNITNRDEKSELTRYCRKLLTFMSHTKDPSALPYLELKSTSADRDIRETASRGVVNVLGIEAISFLRKIERDGTHTPREFYSLYETFGRRVRMEKKNNPKARLDDAHQFLLESVEKEKAGDTVKMIDQVLCETLEGYPASVQREKVADRMVKAGPEYSRPHFEAVKAEIEKTPTAKRKDFTAKGELLDPEPKNEKPDL